MNIIKSTIRNAKKKVARHNYLYCSNIPERLCAAEGCARVTINSGIEKTTNKVKSFFK